jgi:hypothetical protein
MRLPKMLDVSDMNRREPTEMYPIDESKMNRVSRTLCEYDSDTKKANLCDPPMKREFGGTRRP